MLGDGRSQGHAERCTVRLAMVYLEQRVFRRSLLALAFVFNHGRPVFLNVSPRSVVWNRRNNVPSNTQDVGLARLGIRYVSIRSNNHRERRSKLPLISHSRLQRFRIGGIELQVLPARMLLLQVVKYGS